MPGGHRIIPFSQTGSFFAILLLLSQTGLSNCQYDVVFMFYSRIGITGKRPLKEVWIMLLLCYLRLQQHTLMDLQEQSKLTLVEGWNLWQNLIFRNAFVDASRIPLAKLEISKMSEIHHYLLPTPICHYCQWLPLILLTWASYPDAHITSISYDVNAA